MYKTFHFMHIFGISSLNNLFYITPQHISGTEVRTLAWPFLIDKSSIRVYLICVYLCIENGRIRTIVWCLLLLVSLLGRLIFNISPGKHCLQCRKWCELQHFWVATWTLRGNVPFLGWKEKYISLITIFTGVLSFLSFRITKCVALHTL